MTIDINKRYLIQSCDGEMVIIEFAEEQDVLPEEEYADMDAYECYILDKNYEAEMRAIYYYVEEDGSQYLKYREDPTDPKLTTICIQNMMAIIPGKNIEEILMEAEDEPDSNLSMGDIC